VAREWVRGGGVKRDPWIRLAAAAGCLLLLPLLASITFAQATSVQPPGAAVVRVGDRAPEFSLIAGDGRTYSLADLHGKKNLVLVIFRGTW
jgi:cytochrome oxidase Cu insertion factor (SCO1/SenC/PrrC family)